MNRFLAMLSVAYFSLKVGSSLLATRLTLGWKVRQARKAFENELMKGGISKEDAQRMSRCYSVLKDQMLDSMKSGFSWRRKGEGHRAD